MESDIAIKVENLSKMYSLQHSQLNADGNETHELWALKDVSFEIRKGASVGIVGANGSGKSTLLKILAGVTKPTSGKVEIRGKVASILDIGAGFHPELSGRENVFLNGQLLGFSKKEIQGHFDEIVAFSGIEKFIDEPVKNYSNGMYLRLAFSIMVHLDFDVYLLDEVLSVGDAAFMQKAREKTIQLIDSEKTILSVSHHVSELSHRNMYLLLDQGKLQDFTGRKNILSQYLENALSLIDHKVEIASNAISCVDFATFQQSPELSVQRIDLYQDEKAPDENFRTDKPFFLRLEYLKLKDTNTVDPIINLCDSQGETLLSSAPFISGNLSSHEEKGMYVWTCKIPAFFLSSQVYRINLFFLKNTNQIIHNFKDISFTANEKIPYELMWRDILIFKPILRNDNLGIDLEDLNMHGNLFPAFEWQVQN